VFVDNVITKLFLQYMCLFRKSQLQCLPRYHRGQVQHSKWYFMDTHLFNPLIWVF